MRTRTRKRKVPTQDPLSQYPKIKIDMSDADPSASDQGVEWVGSDEVTARIVPVSDLLKMKEEARKRREIECEFEIPVSDEELLLNELRDRVTKVRVTQRKQGAFVTVKGKFPTPDGTVEMKITADPRSWERIFYLANREPEYLGNLFYLHFAKPAFNRLNSTPSRGVHRGREEFMVKMRLGIPIVYCWVYLWLRENEQSWPDSLKQIVRNMKTEGKFIGPNGREMKPKPLQITAYIMENQFRVERRKQGFKHKWTDDLDTFRKSFISKNKYVNYCKTPSQNTVNLKKESLENLLRISF